MKLSRWFFLSSLLISLISSNAFAITIDKFETAQTQVVTSSNPLASEAIPSPESLGATRSVAMKWMAGPACTTSICRRAIVDIAPSPSDRILSHSQDVGVRAQTLITYDGDTTPETLNSSFFPIPSGVNSTAFGSTGVNLERDDATAFQIEVASFDYAQGVPFEIYVRVFSSDQNFSEAKLTLNAAILAPQIFDLPWKGTGGIFTTPSFASGPADFTKVTAIQLYIKAANTSGSDTDLSIKTFKTNGRCDLVPNQNQIIGDCDFCFDKPQNKDSCGLCPQHPRYNNNRDCNNLCCSLTGSPINGSCTDINSRDLCGVCDSNSNNDGYPDVCNTCDADPLNDGNACRDCAGVPNGGKVFDACGVCGGNDSTCKGCDGVPNSNKSFDICGICGGDGKSCLDCAGTPFGGKVIDTCGVCGGNNACQDCKGVPNGTSVVDRCGVCGGDGQSCVNCNTQDVSPLSFILDATAKDQEKAITRMLNDLVKIKPTASNKTYRGKIAPIVHKMQVTNWNISWQIEQTNTQCVDNRTQGQAVAPAFCATRAVNVEKVAEYRVHAKELRAMADTVAARLKKQSIKLVPIAKRQVAQAEVAYKKALGLADQVPTSSVSCN